jgi:hypothetical protein
VAPMAEVNVAPFDAVLDVVRRLDFILTGLGPTVKLRLMKGDAVPSLGVTGSGILGIVVLSCVPEPTAFVGQFLRGSAADKLDEAQAAIERFENLNPGVRVVLDASLLGALAAVPRTSPYFTPQGYYFEAGSKAEGMLCCCNSITDADQPFVLRSICKPLAAAVVLALQDQGLLHIDAPVGTWLPEYAEGEVATLTLRQCITHTSGLDIRAHSDV